MSFSPNGLNNDVAPALRQKVTGGSGVPMILQSGTAACRHFDPEFFCPIGGICDLPDHVGDVVIIGSAVANEQNRALGPLIELVGYRLNCAA
jgi:hypothetical protein